MNSGYFKFFTSSNPDEYSKFKVLKYKVFHDELGWKSLSINSHLSTENDAFDEISIFLGFFSLQDELLGATRGTDIKIGFPHNDYFTQDLNVNPEIISNNNSLFTINALAVEKNSRGKEIKVNYSNHPTIGQGLIYEIFRYFSTKSKHICLLTAIHNESELFFRKSGFSDLGPPFIPKNGDRLLINMYRNHKQ